MVDDLSAALRRGPGAATGLWVPGNADPVRRAPWGFPGNRRLTAWMASDAPLGRPLVESAGVQCSLFSWVQTVDEMKPYQGACGAPWSGGARGPNG